MASVATYIPSNIFAGLADGCGVVSVWSGKQRYQARQSRLAQEANPSYFVLNPPRRSHLHKSRPSSWHSPPACTCLPMCGAELSTRGERYGIFSPAWSSWKGLVTVTLYYSLQVSPGDCNPHTRTHSFCCYLRTCLSSPNTLYMPTVPLPSDAMPGRPCLPRPAVMSSGLTLMNTSPIPPGS